MIDSLKDILERMKAHIKGLRTGQGTTRDVICSDSELKKRTLVRMEIGHEVPKADKMILNASELNLHPAVMMNFSVEGNKLFKNLRKSPCPLFDGVNCMFCYNPQTDV